MFSHKRKDLIPVNERETADLMRLSNGRVLPLAFGTGGAGSPSMMTPRRKEQAYTAQGAWNEGRDAFNAGRPLLRNNPYDRHTQPTMFLNWRLGWQNRQREKRASDTPS